MKQCPQCDSTRVDHLAGLEGAGEIDASRKQGRMQFPDIVRTMQAPLDEPALRTLIATLTSNPDRLLTLCSAAYVARYPVAAQALFGPDAAWMFPEATYFRADEEGTHHA